jgi:molybdopterin/thiamine biosynthesis adenylyltransferase
MTLRVSRDLLDTERDRYHRQSLIEWWDQSRLASAKLLVIGAGALGNEILKLLGLIGVGRTLIFDLDHIERSNLSRCVLFRDHDEGRPKAEVAAERMRELNPDILALGRSDNIITRAGLGLFHWADVVIAGVDNREARVFVNAACARTGRTWVDGAIEGLAGIARVFHPAETACYECTMNATDRKLLAQRRSCALLARDIAARGHVPTTAVAASIVAALQVQEALKLLHGQPTLWGEGIHVQGMWGDFSRVSYQRRDDCMGHDSAGAITPLGRGVADITLEELLARAEAELGQAGDADVEIELSRDLVLELACPECGASEPGRAALGAIREADAACPRCGAHRIVDTLSSISRDGRVDLGQTLADLGVPPFDIVFPRRGFEAQRAWLLDGDAGEVLGALAAPPAQASTASGENPS